jgi:hypothetical protein
MKNTASQRKVIPSGSVQRTSHPVLIDCSNVGGSGASRAVSVLPIMDGDLVAGIEVRCGCGSTVTIECLYEAEAGR